MRQDFHPDIQIPGFRLIFARFPHAFYFYYLAILNARTYFQNGVPGTDSAPAAFTSSTNLVGRLAETATVLATYYLNKVSKKSVPRFSNFAPAVTVFAFFQARG